MDSEGLTQFPEEFILVNIVEEVVRLKVREAVRETGMCQCSKCELDTCAIVLNVLPPKYVTTKRGHLLAKICLMNPDFLMEVNIEVAKALKMVKERPFH